MIRNNIVSVMVALVLVLALGCATSPLGRRQVKIHSSQEMEQLGVLSFQQIKTDMRHSGDWATRGYVQCVAHAILSAMPGENPAAWEVVVFEDESANAFALPGKKIGVNTGLLSVAANQDQLAAVIGHEVGHVIADHSNERVSQAKLAQVGMALAQVAGQGMGMSPEKQQLLGLLGVGVQVGVLLPYSRIHEAEADLIGLDLMANAGFDPAQSVSLWENMSQGGGAPPELLSTHPSHSTRIAGLSKRIPAAQALRNAARAGGAVPRCSVR